MDLTGKVAIVTGASSGIGAATAKALHGIGMKVVGFARRKEMIEQLIENHDGRLFAVKVDLRNYQEILDGFAWVLENVGPIHVLINNAGIINTDTTSNIINGDLNTWKRIVDTNVTSILLCCREAVRIMQANSIDGYIINVSSVAGLKAVLIPYSSMYSTSKFAVRGMTENLRNELAAMNSNIRTTCLNPGIVRTDIIEATGKTKEEADKFVFDDNPSLFSEDIADAIKYLVQTPNHVEITNLTIRPLGEKF